MQCGNFAKLFSIRRIQNLRLMQIVKNISFGTKLSYICFQKESCDNLYSKTIFIRPRYLKRLLIKFVEFRHDNFKIDPFAQHLFMEWWWGGGFLQICILSFIGNLWGPNTSRFKPVIGKSAIKLRFIKFCLGFSTKPCFETRFDKSHVFVNKLC